MVRAVPLRRRIERFPYVPADPQVRNERCEEVYNIQVRGLETRLQATGIDKVVIGVSGGLDSTHALIVAAHAMDRLGLPRENVLAYTMPGFATSEHTLRNAHRLMQALGVSASEIDIRPSATQMLRDIGHPAAEGARGVRRHLRERAGGRAHLAPVPPGQLPRRAGPRHRRPVRAGPGLGHLRRRRSDVALQRQRLGAQDADPVPGPVGDRHRPVRRRGEPGTATRCWTPRSPPSSSPPAARDGDELQGSEKVVGPYELQDFFLYYILRFGYSPGKVAFLAQHAWGDRDAGSWPDLIPEERRNEYSLEEIKHWLGVFLERFFHISQFKRSAMPNAPKVGSGGSLSPRGDWRAPSDGSAVTWLEQLRATVPDSL